MGNKGGKKVMVEAIKTNNRRTPGKGKRQHSDLLSRTSH